MYLQATRNADEIELPVSHALLRSHFMKSATSERLADRDGVPHAEYAAYYARIGAQPGLGMAVTGHIAVSLVARAESGQIFLTERDLRHKTVKVRNLRRAVKAFHCAASGDWDSVIEQCPGLNIFDAMDKPQFEVNAAEQQEPPLFLAQLSHGGPQIPRYLHTTPIGFKRVPRAWFCFKAPKAPSESVSADFVRAAQICQHCGFDGVELNCAHGWLLADMIAAGRTDAVADVVRAIREELPDEVVAVKLCNSPRAREFISLIQNIVDFVEISAGDFATPERMVFNHAQRYAEELASELRQENPPFKVAATGGYHTFQEGEVAVESEKCDIAGFGRLYCQPETQQVIRISQSKMAPKLMKRLGKAFPLMNAGAYVVFWQETLRGTVHGKIKTNKQAAQRLTLFWYFFSMLTYFFGLVTFRTKAQWRK